MWIFLLPFKIKSAPTRGAAGVHCQPHPGRTATPRELEEWGKKAASLDKNAADFYPSCMKFTSCLFFYHKMCLNVLFAFGQFPEPKVVLTIQSNFVIAFVERVHQPLQWSTHVNLFQFTIIISSSSLSL